MKILGNSESSEFTNDDVKQDNDRSNILFLSHLDSKGQRFSILYRIKIIRTWVFSGITILVIFIFKNFFSS